jgi:hypothetical protein
MPPAEKYFKIVTISSAADALTVSVVVVLLLLSTRRRRRRGRRRGGEEEMEEEEEEGEEASIFSFALKVWIKSVSFLLMIKKM